MTPVVVHWVTHKLSFFLSPLIHYVMSLNLSPSLLSPLLILFPSHCFPSHFINYTLPISSCVWACVCFDAKISSNNIPDPLFILSASLLFNIPVLELFQNPDRDGRLCLHSIAKNNMAIKIPWNPFQSVPSLQSPLWKTIIPECANLPFLF